MKAPIILTNTKVPEINEEHVREILVKSVFENQLREALEEAQDPAFVKHCYRTMVDQELNNGFNKTKTMRRIAILPPKLHAYFQKYMPEVLDKDNKKALANFLRSDIRLRHCLIVNPNTI